MTIKITPQQDGEFNFNVKGTTDGFPAYEIWVRDDKGKSVLLFAYNPVEADEGVLSLFPPMEHSYDYSGNSKNEKKGPIVKFNETRNKKEN